MVLETWMLPMIGGASVLPNLSMFRMLRLARLTRLTRLMRAFPQMLTLVKGIVAALRSVFFTLLLLTILLYFFAIIFTTQFRDYQSQYIPRIPEDDDPPPPLEELF